MKIAITADVHLTNREKHPERFHAFENILDQLVEKDIHILIVAGDLFDVTCDTPGDLEQVIKKDKYSKIETIIIPGNHDPVISPGTFSLPNIKYLTKPSQIELDDAVSFLFVPYIIGKSMGEILAENTAGFEPEAWILIGHGDWLSGTSLKNNYEDGMYMPLSRRDLLLYKPLKVFLGHIHAKMDSANVHYPGSPCALDPTEIGYRSFLVFDTKNRRVTREKIETDFLFFDEQITVLPLDDEESYIRNLLTLKVRDWNIPQDHVKKVRIRMRVRGYSKDRQRLAWVIRDFLKDYQFADMDQPDLSQVKASADMTQQTIAKLVKQKIDELDFNPKPGESDRDDILLAALNYIYGGK